jgi:hypothetical protein
MFMTTFAVIVNLFNFMMLIGWPAWKQLRFIYYLRTRDVEFMHSPDLGMPWETSDPHDSTYIIGYIRIGPREFYEWRVNNDGSFYKYGHWSSSKWFNRQRVLHTHGREKNFLGQEPASRFKSISTRFLVPWAIKRYTQEHFVMAKMGGFKEYWSFKGN